MTVGRLKLLRLNLLQHLLQLLVRKKLLAVQKRQIKVRVLNLLALPTHLILQQGLLLNRVPLLSLHKIPNVFAVCRLCMQVVALHLLM